MISKKALLKSARLPKAYWDWSAMLAKHERILPVYTGHESALWTERIAGERPRGRPENVFARHCASEATPRAGRAWGPRSSRLIQRSSAFIDGLSAGGAFRRRIPPGRARSFQHAARHRPWPVTKQSLPHRPPRRLQRSAGRHAKRRRDGLALAGVPHQRAEWPPC